MIRRFIYLILLIIPIFTSCNRGKPDVVFSVKYAPYSIIASTSKKIYYINPDIAKIYKIINLPRTIERVFEPFPYDKLVLYKSQKIDIFNLKSAYIENSINARNTAYNLFALNPYRKLIYQSDTDIFLMENNTLYKIAHSSIGIDTSFSFGSGKYILYRTKNMLNYIIDIDSMKASKLGYYKHIVGSPYIHKLYFINHGILSVFNVKKNKKKELNIRCSAIKLSPASNRLFVISNSNIRLISTYTDKIVKKIDIRNVNNILFARDGYQFIALTKDSLFIFDPTTDSIKFSAGKYGFNRIIPLNSKFGFIGVSGKSITIKTKDNSKKITLSKSILNVFITEIPPSNKTVIKKKQKKGTKKHFIFYTVQYLSTKNKKHALTQRDKFLKSKFPAYIKRLNMEDKVWYRLRIGGFHSKSAATLFSVYLTEKLNHGCWITLDTLDSVPAYKFEVSTDFNNNGKQDIAFIDNDRKLRIFEIDSFKIKLIFTSQLHFPATTKISIKNNRLTLFNDNNIFTLSYKNNKFKIDKTQ